MTGLRLAKGGPWVSIQDLGRPGLQRFGVSESGAVDPVALRVANRLAGNPDTAAALEIGSLGAEFTVTARALTVSAAGPDVIWRIDGEPAVPNRGYTLDANTVIAIRPGRGAAFAYLAVHGGIDVPAVFGSASFHARSGLGGLEGRALQPGDLLPTRETTAPEMELLSPLPHGGSGGDTVIRVVPGPQAAHFPDASLQTLTSTPYRIGARSDRMGVRLEGPALEHTALGYNIVSDGIALGSIQVPGNGLPIVLSADRQTTGGYPKIAVIARADMFRFAQLPPGSTVRFQAIDATEGAGALSRLRRMLDGITVRPAAVGLSSERLLSLNLIDGVVG